MKQKALFVIGVIIGSVSFLGVSCISHTPPAAATHIMERLDSLSEVRASHVPKTMEFVPEEWCKNPRLRKSLTTDFEPRKAVKLVREMMVLPDTMDYCLLDLSQYKIALTPDKDHKLIFPTNSVLSVNGDPANGTALGSAVSGTIFHAGKKHQYKISWGGLIPYIKTVRDVDYSLIGSVDLCAGVESYIMSSIPNASGGDMISSTIFYLVNCVDNRIISMLELARDWNDGWGDIMTQAYRIPAPAGSDIILTKMVSYLSDIEPFDGSGFPIRYSAYKLNDSGELHRIYKPE